MQASLLKNVKKNLSQYSVESLNIICEKDNLKVDDLRDSDGLDIVTSYVLNNKLTSLLTLLEKGYQLDKLLDINPNLEIFTHKLYSEFVTANKLTVLNRVDFPTNQITSSHLLVFLLFKNSTEATQFKASQLNKTLIGALEKMFYYDSQLLNYTDNLGYTVGDYICLFPSIESLNLLLSKDTYLNSIVNVPVSKIMNLLKEYSLESFSENTIQFISNSIGDTAHCSFISNNEYQQIEKLIAPIVLESDLLEVTSNLPCSKDKNISKF